MFVLMTVRFLWTLFTLLQLCARIPGVERFFAYATHSSNGDRIKSECYCCYKILGVELGRQGGRRRSFWISAIGHASKFDKDTFVIRLIVICSFLSLIAGVHYVTTIVSAFSLMAAYAIFRSWMLQTQIKERIFHMKTTTPEEAKELSEELSTDAEKKLMLEYSKALEYQRSKEGKK